MFVTVKADDCAELACFDALDGVIATLPPGATEFTFIVADCGLTPAVDAVTVIVPVPGGGPCVVYGTVTVYTCPVVNVWTGSVVAVQVTCVPAQA